MTIRLDEVTVFDGKLNFLIPHDWEEMGEEGTDHYVYGHPEADSGWLRVSLITREVGDDTPEEVLGKIFEGRKSLVFYKQTGNWVYSFERDSEEQGGKIHLYYWIVANVVQPDLVREAVFSYTVLSERAADQQTAKMAGLIGQIASLANFKAKP